MMRVYATLKARILAGDFAPGERLDPARLSDELAASVTPIRDALHRLTGERLVESWQHEGFRQPLVTEAGLRDLYAWTAEVLGLALRSAEHAALAPPPLATHSATFAETAAAVFAWVGEHSPNREHRISIAAINDRSHRVRLLEARVIAGPAEQLDALAAGVGDRRWADARRANDTYHRRRLRQVADIAAWLRPREGG